MTIKMLPHRWGEMDAFVLYNMLTKNILERN